MPSKNKLITEVFDKWQLQQTIIPSRTLSSFLKEKRNSAFDIKRFQALNKRLYNLPKSLQQLNYFAGRLATVSATLAIRMQQMQQHLLSPMQSSLFTFRSLNKEEKKLSLEKIINKYNSMIALLCSSKQRRIQTIFLHTLANDLFFHIFFYDYASFKTYLSKPSYYPLIRCIYSIIWKNLSSKGWSTWYTGTLVRLKKIVAQKKELIYFAGGTDIIQLLEHGIYTIRIIDPFIPHQKKFYSSGWRFLIDGSIGDQIIWPEQQLILRRDSIKKNGTFSVGSSHLQGITTIWGIYHADIKKQLGTITFERRTIQQKDFEHKTTTKLISFNEVYFIASHKKPWNIDAKKISKKTILYCKQLKKPLSNKILCSLMDVDKYDEAVEFIQFGSNVD